MGESNKGVYLHDIPFDLFAKYFFSGSYESDYISDRYEPVMVEAELSEYYKMTYTISYIKSIANLESATEIVAVNVIGNSMPALSRGAFMSLTGIDLDSLQDASVGVPTSELIEPTAELKQRRIPSFVTGLPFIEETAYEYCAELDGKAYYAIEYNNFKFTVAGKEFLKNGETYEMGTNGPKAEAYGTTGVNAIAIKRNGKVVGHIYECPTVKVIKTDGTKLVYKDLYTNEEVSFEQGSEPKAPIEKYAEYMRGIKSRSRPDFAPDYGNLYLARSADGKGYSLIYARKTETAKYFTTSIDSKSPVKQSGWKVPCATSLPDGMRFSIALMKDETTPAMKLADAGITKIPGGLTSQTEATAMISSSTKRETVYYSSSEIPSKIYDGRSYPTAALKAFLAEYSAATGNEISTVSTSSSERSYGFVTKYGSASFSSGIRSGFTTTSETRLAKIASAAALSSALSGDTMTTQQIIDAFSSCNLYYGRPESLVGTDELLESYSDSAKGIMSSVILASSGNAYTGAYVGKDYSKTLYLYSKGLVAACSSALGYSMKDNEGTSYISSSTGKRASGFAALGDYRQSVIIRMGVSSPADSGQAIATKSIPASGSYAAEAKRLSALRRLHDYDEYELNSKRLDSWRSADSRKETLARSVAYAMPGFMSLPAQSNSKVRKNGFAEIKDRLCELIAQYAYACDPASEFVGDQAKDLAAYNASSSHPGAGRLSFFTFDYALRFADKISSSSNADESAAPSGQGDVKYSFSDDAEANFRAFKEAVLNK